MRMRFSSNSSLRPSGFTLVELIVSMLIFTIFIGAVTATYLSVSRSLRESSEIRQVYGQARYLMDKLTQDIRLNTVDYACFEDLTDGVADYQSSYQECSTASVSSQGVASSLPLISPDGTHRIVYAFDETEGLSILELDWDENASGWVASSGYFEGFQAFELQGVALSGVQFTVAPLSSPYDSDNLSDAATQYQPSVHVVISASTTSSVVREAIQLRLQSAVSSRVYAVTTPF